MYAGVTTASGVSALDSDNSSDIPEWKKILIMKKRAGCSPGVDEHARRNPDSGNVNIVRNGLNVCEGSAGGVNNKFLVSKTAKVVEPDFREISPPKTVTIGKINVELRSVKPVENSAALQEACEKKSVCEPDGRGEPDSDACEDLQYGPGIVDRLRARFLNIGVKQQRKPVVRRFSSLENLPGSQSGPYRINTRGVRQNGFKSGYPVSGNVKKAQSMETLICTTPEQQVFSSSRRPNARAVGGVKARILSRNITPISVFTDENDKPKDKSPSPSVSPRVFTKSVRRWDYGRSVSAPNINEDELPKPDTVKLVKQLFESPTCANSSEKTSASQRFRKIPSTTTPASSSTHPPISNGAITGSDARPAVKKVSEEDAKSTCAKECSQDTAREVSPTPDSDEEKYDDFEINGIAESAGVSSDNNLSANRSCETLVVQEPTVAPSSEYSITSPEEELDICGGELHLAQLESPTKVTPEQLPQSEECHKHSDALSQGRRLEESSRAELTQDVAAAPHPLEPTGVRKSGGEDEMVVAAASSTASSDGESSVTDSFPPKKGGSTWQKPPQSTTSIVFDFRGRKDVEPHISLNPAPFGCRPAKVSRSSTPKRSGSPPRSPVNGIESKDFLVEDDHQNDEDWDEMDIGADLPAISGIVFTGENVKIGRGSLLEKRNKKLNIQFDDKATSTFEYPSENTSPSPMEDSSFNSTIAMGSAANSRLGLSNYTPQVLSSNNEFELGVSQSNHRQTVISPDKTEKSEDVPIMDVLIPADPEDTGGWSATETADILF